MTYYHQLINLPLKTIQEEIASKTTEELTPILIPNGFSHLTLTGSLSLIEVQQSRSYVLDYTDISKKFSAQNSMGWTLNSQFILFKVLFVPKNYL